MLPRVLPSPLSDAVRFLIAKTAIRQMRYDLGRAEELRTFFEEEL